MPLSLSNGVKCPTEIFRLRSPVLPSLYFGPTNGAFTLRTAHHSQLCVTQILLRISCENLQLHLYAPLPAVQTKIRQYWSICTNSTFAYFWDHYGKFTLKSYCFAIPRNQSRLAKHPLRPSVVLWKRHIILAYYLYSRKTFWRCWWQSSEQVTCRTAKG